MGSWLLLACELNASPKNLQPHRRGWRGHYWKKNLLNHILKKAVAACHSHTSLDIFELNFFQNNNTNLVLIKKPKLKLSNLLLIA